MRQFDLSVNTRNCGLSHDSSAWLRFYLNFFLQVRTLPA